MAWQELLTYKKLDSVLCSALRICFGAFYSSPVFSLYVDCIEPPFHVIHEKPSLELYYPLTSISFSSYILTKEHDTLYENCPSYIPNFGIRIKNIHSGTSLLDMRVRTWLLLKMSPWNFKSISCLNPFKNYGKSSMTDNANHTFF